MTMKRTKVHMMAAREAPPIPLDEKYNPRSIDEFVGFASQRAILSNLMDKPYPSAWFLLGPSGLGKTSLAMAVASGIRGELYHVPSQACDKDRVKKIVERVAYHPMNGGWHIVLVDEADQMSSPAQHSFLSVLDHTKRPAGAIFLFTANDTRMLEARFLSRCRLLKFDPAMIGKEEATLWLERIWEKERGGSPPDFEQVWLRSGRNFRTCLNNLELLLLDPSYQLPPLQQTMAAAAGATAGAKPVDPMRRAAALKAWETMRRNRGESR